MRQRMMGVAVAAALAVTAMTVDHADGAPRPDFTVTRDRAGRLDVRADGARLADVLAGLSAVAGVPIASLSADLGRSPVTASAGPAPLEQVVRALVRPHGVVVVYGAGREGAAPVAIVVVPAGSAARLQRAAAPADVRPALPDLDDLGPGADPTGPERAVLALGEILDDPDAVALLETAARGESGLDPDDPARLLARSLLSTLPGRADEEDEEP